VSSDSANDRILAAFLRVVANVIIFNQQVADRLGLGMSDMQFMTYLQQHGPLTPGQLAQLSGLTTGTVTGVIDRLEKAGYVRRNPHPDDRRKVVVSRDEERIRRDIVPLYADRGENLTSVLGEFDAEQLEVISDFLTKLADSGDEPSTLPTARRAR
jgi:DNA-binding MarR family transcriptional regulator